MPGSAFARPQPPRRNLRPMDDATLERFADLVVGFGANVQQDQIVTVGCEPGKEYLVRALAASAYRHGARFVDVGWFDPYVKRARVEHARAETLDFVPSVVRRARARARRAARRARRAVGAERARPARRTSIPRSSARTGCRRSRRASRSSTTARRTGRSARARRRSGPTWCSPSWRARAARTARARAAARAAARRGRPDRAPGRRAPTRWSAPPSGCRSAASTRSTTRAPAPT